MFFLSKTKLPTSQECLQTSLVNTAAALETLSSVCFIKYKTSGNTWDSITVSANSAECLAMQPRVNKI